ncbi:MAG: hypothetical protein ABIH25_01335 [Candidatus Woesearchaeota archaeon]
MPKKKKSKIPHIAIGIFLVILIFFVIVEITKVSESELNQLENDCKYWCAKSSVIIDGEPISDTTCRIYRTLEDKPRLEDKIAYCKCVFTYDDDDEDYCEVKENS